MAKNKWVVPVGSKWGVKEEGKSRPSSIHSTKEAARKEAIKKAKQDGAEVIVQGKDGKIQSKDSYGNDPNPPRDNEH